MSLILIGRLVEIVDARVKSFISIRCNSSCSFSTRSYLPMGFLFIHSNWTKSKHKRTPVDSFFIENHFFSLSLFFHIQLSLSYRSTESDSRLILRLLHAHTKVFYFSFPHSANSTITQKLRKIWCLLTHNKNLWMASERNIICKPDCSTES